MSTLGAGRQGNMACVPFRNWLRKSGKCAGRLEMWYCGEIGMFVRLFGSNIRGGAIVLDRITLRRLHSIFLGLSGRRSTRWPRRRFKETSSSVSEVKVWSRWNRHLEARYSGPVPSLIWWKK